MKLSYLIKGFPGHPLHPPLTDATIGAYTVATVLAVLAALGLSEENTATGWWLTLVVGLALRGPTAATGFVDWLGIAWGTPPWRTATRISRRCWPPQSSSSSPRSSATAATSRDK